MFRLIELDLFIIKILQHVLSKKCVLLYCNLRRCLKIQRCYIKIDDPCNPTYSKMVMYKSSQFMYFLTSFNYR